MQQLPPETDAAVIQSDVNRRYFTGMQSSAGTVVCFRDAAYLIIDFRYIEKARECVKDCTVIEQHDCLHSSGNCSKAQRKDRLCRGDGNDAEPVLQAETAAGESGAAGLQRYPEPCDLCVPHGESEEEIDKIRRAQRIAEIALRISAISCVRASRSVT
ncbi:MAG: aminopeptidase P family N-terminal domain-containing protein [Ruminococcus callidus]